MCEGRTYGVGRVCVNTDIWSWACVCEGRTYGVGRVCARDGRMELGVCV